MPHSLLVFDLDGTLAETAGDLIAALNHVMALEAAPQVELAQARVLLGAGGRALIQRGLASAGQIVTPARLEVLFGEFLRYYNANIAAHSHLYAGVSASLDRFHAAGWRFAVCTNKMEHSAVTLLRALGAENRFTAICGQDTFAVCKPDPEALRQTIAKAGGDFSRAIMVGDSETDIRTAQAAGVPCVAVDFGYADKHVSAFGPDRVISHFDDLWGAVAGLQSLDLEPRAP
jgi:phosphoglycolate phosphatase